LKCKLKKNYWLYITTQEYEKIATIHPKTKNHSIYQQWLATKW